MRIQNEKLRNIIGQMKMNTTDLGMQDAGMTTLREVFAVEYACVQTERI